MMMLSLPMPKRLTKIELPAASAKTTRVFMILISIFLDLSVITLDPPATSIRRQPGDPQVHRCGS
jgi:hypothetical protein